MVGRCAGHIAAHLYLLGCVIGVYPLAVLRCTVGVGQYSVLKHLDTGGDEHMVDAAVGVAVRPVIVERARPRTNPAGRRLR